MLVEFWNYNVLSFPLTLSKFYFGKMLGIYGILFAFDLHNFTRGKEFVDLERDLVLYSVSPISVVPLFFTSFSSQKQAIHDHITSGLSLCRAVSRVRARILPNLFVLF